MSNDLFCAIMRLLSTNERIEIEIFRFLRHFLRIYKNRMRYKADRMEEKADLWPTLILTLKTRECKLFQI